MSAAVNAPVPELDLGPISVAHRTLRALAGGDISAAELRATVRDDGHNPELPHWRITLGQLLAKGLVHKRRMPSLGDTAFGITTEGQRLLKHLELQVAAALAAHAQTSATRASVQHLASTHAPNPERPSPFHPHVGRLRPTQAGRHSISGAESKTPPPREGATYAFTLPSRIGDRLHYPGGRVTDMDGNAVTA